jgi:hypothetical protein
MLLGTVAIDPNRLLERVPVWVGALRPVANRGLAEFESGLLRAVDVTAAAIVGRSKIDELAPLDVLHAECGQLRVALDPLLDELGTELLRALGDELQPLDLLATQIGGVGEALIARHRRSWDDALRGGLREVLAYGSGHVDGGGLVLSLLTDLAPELAGHIGEVAAILGERTAYLPGRVEAAAVSWIARVHRELEELLLTWAAPARSGATPAERLEGLLARAAELGVQVEDPPTAPSERFLARLEARLDQVARKRLGHDTAVQRGARLATLTALARTLGVKIRKVPPDPGDAWLDRLESRLRAIAAELAIPVPAELDATRPNPLVDEGATGGVAPRADEVHAARIHALLDRATEAGLDLGRIPPAPTTEWLVETEAKLTRAIERQREDRLARAHQEEGLRRSRVDWLVRQAARLGETLAVPAFPTDDWLRRAEQRLTARVLTPPPAAGPTGGALRQRFRQLWSAAAETGVDLGALPKRLDPAWLARAERAVDAARPECAPTAKPARGRAWLAIHDGTVQEQRFELGEGEVVVGRTRSSAIRLRDDAGVSRRHCAVRCEGGRYVLRDLGSRLGTIVDGVAVEEVELVGEERILIGDTELVFHAPRHRADPGARGAS